MSVSLFAFLITLIFNVDFYNYKILGACNPLFAYKALQAEDKIGTMLPCLRTSVIPWITFEHYALYQAHASGVCKANSFRSPLRAEMGRGALYRCT